MNRQTKIIFSACLTLLACAQLIPRANAFPPPIGAVAGAQKLQKGMGNGKDDLVFSPILLEMAKLIGRTGLPPGFFLQDDSAFPDEQGVDLRTLLLYQAGLIKMPIRLITGKRQTPVHAESVPSLTVPPIPEPRSELSAKPASDDMPSVASEPLPREPEGAQVVTPKANVGDPEKISFRMHQSDCKPAPSPLLLLDVAKFQAEMIDATDNEPDQIELKAEMPRLAMTMPRRTAMPFITNNAFRLWTYRPDSKGLANAASAQTDAEHFSGTFVVATTGAIKSITGRHFVLSDGRLLASNRGGELLLHTAAADVSVEAGATAVVDITTTASNSAVIHVFALEANNGASVIVSVANAREKTYQLAAGQSLSISKGEARINVARGNFSVPQFVSKELMLRCGESGEQYVTLSTLKKRLDSRQ